MPISINPILRIEWIPVAERLPSEGEPRYPNFGRYLVCTLGGSVLMATRERVVDMGMMWIDVAVYKRGDGEPSQCVLHGITHWAELPASPSLIRSNML